MATDWNQRWIDLSREIAQWSKDRSRKVGCVVVGPNNEIRTTGYNGFPRGVDDNIESRHQRPAKYLWTEHAERNSIYNAARMGTPLDGCRLYLHWFPCIDCARAIVQSGITTVVCIEPDWNDPQYGPEFKLIPEMFQEAGVEIVYVPGQPPVQQ